jgi:membrane protein required for colicin V production
VIDVNGFDIGLLILLALLVLFGLIKGLTRLLIGMGALIVGFLLAAQFHQQLAVKLTWINVNTDVMLSWADRMAGGAVGLVAAMLIAAWLVLPLVAYSPFGEKALRDSVLAPYVTVVANKKVEDLRQYWRERWQATPDSLEVHRPRPGSVA